MNSVVIVFRYRVSDWIVLLFFISGWKWISRKMFVIIIVLEWSRVEIGVGFFMVEGSYGWSLN